MSIGVYNVEELDDVWVVHLFQKRDLANSCAGDSFIFCFEANLLESDNSALVEEISGFVDDAICTWTSDCVREAARMLHKCSAALDVLTFSDLL